MSADDVAPLTCLSVCTVYSNLAWEKFKVTVSEYWSLGSGSPVWTDETMTVPLMVILTDSVVSVPALMTVRTASFWSLPLKHS